MDFSVASINANGLTSDPDKRTQLSAWINAHSTDVAVYMNTISDINIVKLNLI